MAIARPLHPAESELILFALGKIEGVRAEEVREHLDQCDECRRCVAETPDDTLLEGIRRAQVGDDPGAGHSRTMPPGLAEQADFRIKRELGRGGMGVVYLAHNTLMGRDEVIKVMGRQILDRDGIVDRFLREIRAVARLRHANIVTAYSAKRLDESIIFAMEYVDGLDLAKVVKAKGPLPVSHACFFAHQAALGLQHAHEEGMVHRDIKPANLMLARKGSKATIKILDFGLAKFAREERIDGGLTSEGQALGTPDFIAPEQITDAQAADIRADIYSLGGTLYYLLSGRPPFEVGTLYDLYQAHISRVPEPVNSKRPEIPSELIALVGKLMAKKPEDRFQTPGEVAEALRPFFQKGAERPPVEDRGATSSAPARAHAERAADFDPAGSHRPAPAGPPTGPAASLLATDPDPRGPDGPEGIGSAGAEPAGVGASDRRPGRRRAMVATACVGVLILLGVTFRKRIDPSGTLVVDVNEPGAVVHIDREPVEVTWDANRQRAAIQVKPGEREVTVTKDGFVARGMSVAIAEGDRVIVMATLEPSGPARQPQAEDASTARVAQEPAPPPGEIQDNKAGRPDRKAYTFESTPDDWKTQGDELIQTRKPGPSFPTLLFGDPKWTDYEFSLKAMMEEGDTTYDSFGVIFRSRGPESRYTYGQAMTAGWTSLTASVFGKKDVALTKEGPNGISLNVWYNVRVIVKGGRMQGFISDGSNETMVFDVEDNAHPGGRVGLMTMRARCRFRDLKVVALDGTTLWEGLPEGLPRVPASTTPIPSPSARARGEVAGAVPPRPSAGGMPSAPPPADEAAKVTPQPAAETPRHRPFLMNSFGMRLNLIPAGKFLMGSSDEHLYAAQNEKPAHEVEITQPFYMGTVEVTNGLYKAVTSTSVGESYDRGEMPARRVSWKEAIIFCNLLSEREGLMPYYRISGRNAGIGGTGYRLPREAEWEYACRGGTTTQFPHGDSILRLSDYAWTDENSKEIQPVGLKKPNAFGLYDMLGNVSEWCMDRITVPFGEVQANGPIDLGLESERVVRGGSYEYPPKDCRPAIRWAVAADTKSASNRSLGFRVVRDPGASTLLSERSGGSGASNRRPAPKGRGGASKKP